MNILVHKDPPQELVRIVNELYSTIRSIKQVIFDGNIDLLHGKMAVFVPDTGSIIIDLAACAKDIRWMKKGSLYVPNVWFNMLYCVYHEYAHAKQVLVKGWEDVDKAILEAGADHEAIDLMVEWAGAGKIPKLREMGWVINLIRDKLNKAYITNQNITNYEIDALDSNAAAFASTATLLSTEYITSTKEDQTMLMENLCEHVQSGDIGVTIRGIGYLYPEEFLMIDDHYKMKEATS